MVKLFIERALILYENSGTFAELYRDKGVDVVVKDILLDNQDARLFEYDARGFDLIIGFPPCTHLAGSGARWWAKKGEAALVQGLSHVHFVLAMVAIYNPEIWWLENPVGRLPKFIGSSQWRFDPMEYAGYADNPEAEAYTKKTCIWGKFTIPKPNPMPNIHGSKMHQKMGGGQGIKRSKTPQGWAKAMADSNYKLPATP